MTGKLSAIDLAVLVVYLGGVVGMGCWFVRKSRNTDEFMAAGRSLPGWVVGLSILGTFVSTMSFLGNPGKSFGGNWNPFVFSLTLPVAAWIAVRYFVPFYRQGDSISAYSHLEQRFGPWARVYAVICYLLTQLGRMGSILYLVALALAPLTGWDLKTIIIVTGVLVTLYTLMGGIEAVIWTDVAQSIVLSVGMLVCVALLLFGMPDGPGQIFQLASEGNKFSLGDFGPSLTKPTFWVVLAYGLFINLQNFGIDQSIVQRYMTARSDADARRSVWWGALLYVPISALLFFIGTALFAFYSSQPDLLPTSVVKDDAVFPHFIATQLPVGMTGLLIAAVLAAGMSSVDSSLNCSATLILCDIYKRFLRPKAGERESMRVLYITTLIWGGLGTAAALAMIRVKSALDAWWQMSGIFSGGMLGLFLLGIISRKANNAGAVCGLIVAVLSIAWMTLSQTEFWPDKLSDFRNPLDGFLITVVGTLSLFLVGLLLSWLLPQRGGAEVQDSL
jgi:SSS family solute:Na+ symporter